MRWNESKAIQGCAIFFLVFAVILLVFIIPSTVKDVRTFGTSPRLLPDAVAILIGVLAVWLFFEGRGQRNAKNQKQYGFDFIEVRLVVITLAVVATNLLLIEILGYMITTGLSLGALMWLFGYRKTKMLIATSVVFPVTINYFFQYLLRLYLP